MYFVHKFIEAGMEEDEISEARSNMQSYVNDMDYYSVDYMGWNWCRFWGEGDEEE